LVFWGWSFGVGLLEKNSDNIRRDSQNGECEIPAENKIRNSITQIYFI
jgi:hypothetical protein